MEIYYLCSLSTYAVSSQGITAAVLNSLLGVLHKKVT